jgi:hypothetical protein
LELLIFNNKRVLDEIKSNKTNKSNNFKQCIDFFAYFAKMKINEKFLRFNKK